jgi:hypothetical protein
MLKNARHWFLQVVAITKKIMQISFHGAARTVTGSKHLVTLNNGYKISGIGV